MQQLIARHGMLTDVSSSLQEAPAVALVGARQVGKTTLARQVADAWPGHSRLFDLEVPAVREALTETPESVLRGSEGLVVVDEVQRRPALFEVLRPICDDPDRRAAFLLLGSASPDLLRAGTRTDAIAPTGSTRSGRPFGPGPDSMTSGCMTSDILLKCFRRPRLALGMLVEVVRQSSR